jgi:cyclic-di-AMP phosphodiesterase PgpH
MNNEETVKRRVRADPYHVMAWVDGLLERRPLRTAFIGLVVLVVTVLIGPRLFAPDSILSKLKVGERAEGNIKATRSFNLYPGTEKVEKERAAAAEKVLPVFDHQTSLRSLLVTRIGRAFDGMLSGDAGVPPAGEEPRSPGAPAQAKLPAPAQAPHVPPAKLAPGGGAGGAARTEDPWEDRRALFSNILQTEVSRETFVQLRKAAFSTEARATLLYLVGWAMNQLVLTHRGALAGVQGGITVRHLDEDGKVAQAGEERVSGPTRLKDVQQIREEMRIQAEVHAAKLSPPLARAVVQLAQSLTVPNFVPNQAETNARIQAAREGVIVKPNYFVKGQVILRDGDPITAEHLTILKTMESLESGAGVGQVLLGIVIVVLLFLLVVLRFVEGQFRRFFNRPRDLLAVGVLLIGMLGLAKSVLALGSPGTKAELPVFLLAIPIASGAMLARLLITAEASVVFAVISSALTGLLMESSLTMTLYYLVTALTGAAGIAFVQSRSTILRAGLAAGFVGAVIGIGFRLFRDQLLSTESLHALVAALAGGLLSAFVTLALLPAMEWLFAYTTDVTLLELANLNHPLLRDLILRAPGTYHHSMIVGSLSEAACEVIGANGLLARVASYYHDIGKTKNADYFAENFKPGENPHLRLKPSMSALIIRSHVKDTLEMLREHRVPELVIETATQHHGKTLIEYFFHKATEAKEKDEEVREEDYRYPGPKPQTREAGIIMLADAVEAAARSLPEPTEDRLQGVVQRVINTKFTDGQLDHCDLTLRDLHLIAKSFLQVLRGIYHQRPTYPWQQAKREELKRASDEVRKDTARHKAITAEEIEEEKEKEKERDREKDREKEQRDREKEKERDKRAAAEPPSKSSKQAKNEKKGKPVEPRAERSEHADNKKLKAKEPPRGGDHDGRPAKEEGGGAGGTATVRAATAVGSESGEYGPPPTPPSDAGAGSGAADPKHATEDQQTGNPDLKRLGLN